MSPMREKFICSIQALPYDIDKEVLNKETTEILQDVVQTYIELYGTEDLSDIDKKYIESLIQKRA